MRQQCIKYFKLFHTKTQMRLYKNIIIRSFLVFSGIFLIKTVIAGVLIIGSWSLTIDSTDLISGAGSDITSPIECKYVSMLILCPILVGVLLKCHRVRV